MGQLLLASGEGKRCPTVLAVENVDMDDNTEEIMEIETGKLDEINVKKKKNSLLNKVLVTGLLKNLNDKVSNKLDNEAQSELVDIINEKVKDGYEVGLIDFESEVEKAISFDEGPTNDHIITTANKNRVKHPSNRRLPSKESRLSLSDTQERDNIGTNDVDEVFENLLNSDDVCEPNHITDYEEKEGDIPSSDSYVDDFDALLEEDNAGLINIENDIEGDVDAEFDALLKEENFEIEANNTHSLLAKESNIHDKNAEIKENESVTDMKETILKEKQKNSSMEDIFEKLENNGSSLLEMETLLEKGLLEKSD